MIYSNHDLLKKIAAARGATDLAFGDNFHNTLRKWVVAEGGSPKFADSQNDLAHRLSRAIGVSTKHGDSTTRIFQRLASLLSGHSLHDCLYQIFKDFLPQLVVLPDLPIDAGLTPLPDFTVPSGLIPGGVTWAWSETPGALFYDFKYGTDSNFAPGQFTAKIVAAPTLSAAFTGLTAGTNWWIIRARSLTGVSPWPLPTGIAIS